MKVCVSGYGLPTSYAGVVLTPHAPVISSISPSSGDAAGGTSVTIRGVHFTGATSASVGGVALTSFTVVSDYVITGVTGAHASGVVSVSVTGPGGTTSVSALFTYNSAFDPATLNPTGWWRADYSAASAWTGQIGGNSLSSATQPSNGTAVNGYTPADFDGVNDELVEADDWSTFVTGDAGSVLVLFNADTAAAAAANTYDDPALVSDGTYGFNLGFSDGGIGVAFYDNDAAAWKQQRVACSASAWHLAKLTWDGATISIGVDGGAMTTLAAQTLETFAGAKLTVGKVAISATAYFDGKILEILVKGAALSSTDINNFRAYANDRYGISV